MRKKKILLIVGIAVPVLLVVAIIALGTHFFSTPLALSISVGAPAAAASGAAPAPAEETHEEEPEVAHSEGILVDLGSKVVNLADPGGYRYLKVGVVLELKVTSALAELEGEERTEKEEEIRTELLARRALIDDSLISCLSNKTFGEIFSVEGKQKLREELVALINERLELETPVLNLYFTDFVIN